MYVVGKPFFSWRSEWVMPWLRGHFTVTRDNKWMVIIFLQKMTASLISFPPFHGMVNDNIERFCYFSSLQNRDAQ